MKLHKPMYAYQDLNLGIEDRIEDLLGRMTLSEKAGQMAQIEKNSITPLEAAQNNIGSILSGGGAGPEINNPQTWFEMVISYLEGMESSRLRIPSIYGVDAVHGHGNVHGATIFPHNIGLGATRDADLVERIGQITAMELAATGIQWNFAPAVSVARDIRWGRTFESYSEDTGIVSELGAAYIRGLQGSDLKEPTAVLASVKHFVADGGTCWGTTVKKYDWLPGYWEQNDGRFMIDQGEAHISEELLRSAHLPPYIAAIEAGARNIMVSYSSWDGLKMHAQKYLLTEVLKGELGFDGFLVSDWRAVDQLSPDYYVGLVKSINAGIDMVMVPHDYKKFISNLILAVEKGAIPQVRIDDAVRRILRVKFEMGLFENPIQDDHLLPVIGSANHRDVAREAVRKSAVLLKNEQAVLPLSKETSSLLVIGQAADDIGISCGGWTVNWMGGFGEITPGTSILEGIQKVVSDKTQVYFTKDGSLPHNTSKAPAGIVVIGENPYAEGYGDNPTLSLSAADITLLEQSRAVCDKLVVILISGRPLIITDHLSLGDAWVAAWLPGTEGHGVVDVLFGDYPFTGRLPFTWPRDIEQLPFDFAEMDEKDTPLFPLGFGLEI